MPAFANYYITHDMRFVDKTYKALTKEYRLATTTMTPCATALERRVTPTYPNFSTEKLTHNIQNMMTHSKTKKLVYRLYHDALLMGARANRYFHEVQHAHKYDPGRIYPRHNIFDITQPSTYQYEFFDAPLVRPLWAYTNRLIDKMGLPTKATTVDQVLIAIHEMGGKSHLLSIVNLNLITLTMKAIWNTYVGQMEKWRTHRQDIPTVQSYARRKIVTSYKTQIKYEINQIPHHVNTIEVHDIYKDSDLKRVTERQKCLLRTYSYNKKRLRKNEARAFKATWEKTGLAD